MTKRYSLEDVLPKTNKQGGFIALGVLSILLAVPTLIYMWISKKDKDKKEVFY